MELLENGASSDMSREDGWSPLHAASRFGHAATALALLNVGQANFEAATGDHGSTPLHVAAISGFDEVWKTGCRFWISNHVVITPNHEKTTK